MPTSNEMLVDYLTRCDETELHILIGLMRSRVCRESKRLADEYSTAQDVPPAETESRRQLAQRVTGLLGWYGSNAISYGVRRITKGRGAKQYYAVALDVTKLIRKRLDKKQRPDLPRTPHVAQLEEMIVGMCLQKVMSSMTPEELEQLFREAGLEDDVAAHAARAYSPGLAAGGLPLLVKLLGKKTVSTMISQIIVSITARFVGKKAASTLAKQLLVRLPQKLFARIVSVIGLILLGVDVLLFATSPARRITIKAVPFIAACRVKASMANGRAGKEQTVAAE